MKKILIVTLSVSIVLIGFPVVSVAEEGRERVGNWIVEKEEDPLTDKLLTSAVPTLGRSLVGSAVPVLAGNS